MEDESLINQINKLSLVILLGSIPVFVLVAMIFLKLSSTPFRFLDIVYSIVLYIVLVFIHESLHGLFFKLFKPSAKIQFGFTNGMAYAGSLGNRYGRFQILTVLLVPFVFITIGLFMFTQSGILSPYVFIFNAVTHTSSCVVDFYFAYLIAKVPGKITVEDTDTGIRIYQVI